jgi:hypothetical protein
MTVGVPQRLRIVSIHADMVLHFRFGTELAAGRWRPIAQDGADLPAALRGERPALAMLGPGETADFAYTPTRPGRMALEVWIEQGQRIVVPVDVRAPGAGARR